MTWAATIVLAADDLPTLMRCAKNVQADAPTRGAVWVATTYQATDQPEPDKEMGA